MDMPPFAENVALLHAEAERITNYLTHLPAEAWTQPSTCDVWQVRDVVAHLVGVAEFYAGNITRGLEGDTEPPPGRPPAGSITAAMAAEGVAQRAIAEREKLGEQLLTTFRAANDHLEHVLTSLRPAQYTIPCYHPGGIVQPQQFVDLRLKELAVHEWDIRASLEPEAHLAPACLPAIIRLLDDAVASGSMRWGFRSGEHLTAPVRYRIEVTEPVPYHTDVVVTGDAIQQDAGGDGQPDVTFRCDTETFVLLVYGRLPFDQAVDDGRLLVAGDQATARAFTQWFTGI